MLLYRATAPVQEVDQLLENGDRDVSGDQQGPFVQERLQGSSLPVRQLSATPTPSPAALAPQATVAAVGQTETVTISMTDTGFTPSSVTVSAGSAVVFVNNGQGLHWPASDVHPTHQILPAFDSLRGLSTGEQYSFTFTQKGSWRFHDHLSPGFTGTVVVE